MSIYGDKSDDEYSVIGDKGEIGFLDSGDDKSVCGYNPSDEGPVIISVPFAFEQQRPQSVSVDEVSSNAITIRNTSSESVELWGIQIYASNPADSFTLSLMEPSKPGFKGSSSLEDRVLQPSKTLTVWLSCKPKEIGMHTCVVHFDVGDDKIERVVFVLAEDKISKALASKKPYQRGERKKTQFAVNSYVTGVRPARAPGRPFCHKLPVYEIPKEIRSILEDKQIPDAILGGLSKKNYVPYFRTLLIMEELRLEEDIRAYDMENAIMRSRGRQFLVLEVLGLAERRPSLVHGDSVYARLAAQCADDTPVYEGYIHRVEADQVYLKFADDFHHRHSDRNSYNIRFMYNRVNMRRLYQATEAAEELPADFLFPSESVTKRQIKPTAIVPICGSLNEEQLNAVKTILGCKGGVPYIINGPPGTGKTRTLVEVVLQLYMSRKNPRILICASSNSAADHILERMLDQRVTHLRENDIIRLNASSRPYEDMNPDYLRFCFEEDGLFKCPPLRTLLRCRIIITTYMSASLLHAEGVKKGNFSHIILDEAGQASEPETMVPISNLWQKDTVIVLAGDPKQLGPVIFSSDAKMHGLAKSYLERLFDCELYSKGGEGYVTTLLRNYRSHRDILQLPSELFYGGQLIACHEVMKSVPWADLLPNKEFPILFSGVQAYDEREGNNPSWFNRTEASIVVKLVKKLKERKVSEDTIGVITPYRQQVAKIKVALEDAGILNIKIGSVEQFQGQEREVIIVSTVRSTVKHDEFDRIYYLGFLSNPKRFNVAITRAKSLLVIIGNPHIICKDHNWEKLLWRCVDNNSYEGCSLPERQFFNYDNPTEEWSPAPVHETEDWSGAADQESQWGWSDAAVQGGHCEGLDVEQQGLDVEQQGLTGGWSDDVGKETQSGWSNAVEHITEGEWSGSPEQATKGEWSDAADQESQWNDRDEVQQGTGGGWSESAEEGVNGGWSGDAGQETQCGCSNAGEQDTVGHWSYGVEQGMERVRLGGSGQGVQGARCHAPERKLVGRSHASEVHEGNRPYVEQEGTRGGLSDSAKKGITRPCSLDARQETQWQYSDAGEQGAQGHRSDGVKPGTQGGTFDGSDQGARKGWSHAAGQGIQKVRPHAAEPGVQRGWLHASDRGVQGERSHATEQGREVIKAEVGYGQEYIWTEDYPKPVKDEDEWSDGWK